MLSVIIATEGQEQPAVATLSSLIAGAASGLIRDVILVDRMDDGTIARVADVAGCNYLAVKGSRAKALSTGAQQSRSPWLLFLHAGAMLDSGWTEEASQFLQNVAMTGRSRAAIFRHARSPYDQPTVADWLRACARMITGPRTDQGLLIARDHYERLGGYSGDGRSEAKLLHSIGRSARVQLRSGIVSGAI